MVKTIFRWAREESALCDRKILRNSDRQSHVSVTAVKRRERKVGSKTSSNTELSIPYMGLTPFTYLRYLCFFLLCFLRFLRYILLDARVVLWAPELRKIQAHKGIFGTAAKGPWWWYKVYNTNSTNYKHRYLTRYNRQHTKRLNFLQSNSVYDSFHKRSHRKFSVRDFVILNTRQTQKHAAPTPTKASSVSAHQQKNKQ